MTRLLVGAYLVETGVLLVLAPWTALWDRNLFAMTPWLGGLMNNAYVRGGVTGVGLVTASAGVRDLAALIAAWWSSPDPRDDETALP